MRLQIIMAMAAATFATSQVQAQNLPNEIDYGPYYGQYRTLDQQVDKIEESLVSLNSELQAARRDRAKYVSQINSVKQNITRTLNEINSIKREISDQKLKRRDLKNQVQITTNKLNNLEGRRVQLRKSINQQKNVIRPLQDKIVKLKGQLSKLNQEIGKVSTEISNLKGKRKTTKSNIVKNQNLVKSAQDKITKLKTRSSKIDQVIIANLTEVNLLKSNITANIEKKSQAATKKTELKARAVKIQAKLNKLIAAGAPAEEIRKVQARLKSIKSAIKKQGALIASLTGTIKNQKAKVQTVQNKVASLKREKSQIPAKIQKNKTVVAQTKTKIQTQKQKVTSLTSKIQLESNKLQSAKTTKVSLVQKIDKKNVKLVSLNNTLNDTKNRINGVKAAISRNQQVLAKTQKHLNNTVKRIGFLRAELPRKERVLKTSYASLDSKERQLNNVQGHIVQVENNIYQGQRELGRAESERDAMYSAYDSRKRLYNSKLNLAKQLGSSQTDSAVSLGAASGVNYVESASQKIGSSMGIDLAIGQAQYWSGVRAEIDGYKNGYNAGYASASEQNRANADGQNAGLNAADNYAQTQLKPKFFEGFYVEELNTSVTQSFKSMQLIPQVSFNKQSYVELVSLTVTALTTKEIDASLNTITGLDTKISQFATNLNVLNNTKAHLADAYNVYVDAANFPYQSFDCNNVYKDVQVFKQACSDTYHIEFRSRFEGERYQVFGDSYTELYESKLEQARIPVLNTQYEKKYQLHYPIAEDTGIVDGKQQIYTEVFEVAYNDGYSKQLPIATKSAKTDAKLEVKSWISNNAAITINGAKASVNEVRSGAQAAVLLSLKNVSPRSVTRPIEVKITSVKNAQMVQRSVLLNTIAGNSIKQFDNLKFKVNSNLPSNQVIEIRGNVILPGDKYQAQRIESFKVITKTAINPKIATNLIYDQKPNIKRWRTYFTHNLDIKVKASIEKIPAGYTLKVTPLGDSKDHMDFKTALTMSTGSIGTSSSAKTIRFSYKFKMSAKKETIRLQIDYLYQGKVLKTEQVTMKPHK